MPQLDSIVATLFHAAILIRDDWIWFAFVFALFAYFAYLHLGRRWLSVTAGALVALSAAVIRVAFVTHAHFAWKVAVIVFMLFVAVLANLRRRAFEAEQARWHRLG